MDKALTGPALRSFEIRQMSVEMMGDTAVVSFVQSQRAVCDGRDCDGTSFIVDLWQRRDGVAYLRVRYASAIPPQPSASPARPTGKE